VIPDRFRPVLEESQPLTDRFRGAGHRLFLVGGTVRDLILGAESDGVSGEIDFDFTTDARPDEIKRALSGWADSVWTQGERFGTIGAARDGRRYEITTHRAEAYHPDSRKPDVAFSDDIAADLSRRDFTINAMALELTSPTPTLVDPFHGAEDLARHVLRTPIGPDESFSDDPLRMLRAARFIARHRMEPEPGLTEAVTAMADRLSIVSAERIRDELDKLMVTPHPSAGLWFCVDTGPRRPFLPELPRCDSSRTRSTVTRTCSHTPSRHRERSALRPRPSSGDPPPFDFRRTRSRPCSTTSASPHRGYQKGKGVTFHHHDAVGARMTRKRSRRCATRTTTPTAITELVALHLRLPHVPDGLDDSRCAGTCATRDRSSRSSTC
jgi:poly(A) polymerase